MEAVVEVAAGFDSDLLSLGFAPFLEPFELNELESVDRESVR